jgi:hypothetical protein
MEYIVIYNKNLRLIRIDISSNMFKINKYSRQVTLLLIYGVNIVFWLLNYESVHPM